MENIERVFTQIRGHHVIVRSNNAHFRLGVIGDLHTHWDRIDVNQFADTDYDLLYFTGDLGGGTSESCLRMAREMAGLRHPTLVMPGNNDTVDIEHLAAELAHQNGLNRLLSMAGGDKPPNPIVLCGYSRHTVHASGMVVDLIAARPHSMGGPTLSFPDYMQATYGVTDLSASTARMVALVDDSDADALIFLAHNGPLGLGEEPHAMWGCDFKEDGGDWGDPDLTEAIAHARATGKRVLAVIGGHMHLRTKQGEERPWKTEVDDILYINAARVPRIFSGPDDIYRHHVAVTVAAEGVTAEEVLFPQYG
jgi:uncharacterized protein (TIGR04168 family)